MAQHETCKSEYLEHVNRYIQESQTTLLPVNVPDVHSQESTAAPTEPFSPGQRPIYLKAEVIGRGDCGQVYRINNVSTGVICAGKIFFINRPAEVEIMRSVSHVSTFIHRVI